MKRYRSLCIILTGLSLVVASFTTDIAQAKPSTKKPAQASKKKASEPRETVIVPVRYIRGYRMVKLLQMFIPRSQTRNTMIRYSPALHQLLIRAPKSVLKILENARERLDVPQTQFQVNLYFVRALVHGKTNSLAKEHPALNSYLQKAYPMKRSFALTNYVYVRATNHEETKLKATHDARISAPSIKLVLHQAPTPNALVSMNLKIWHHKEFSAVTKSGTNTMFITSQWLETKLFTQVGTYTLVGHSPMRAKNNAHVRVLVVAKVDRLDNSKAKTVAKTKKANSPKKTAPKAWGKNEIRAVIRANQKGFKACYESKLKKLPKLRGRIVVFFEIKPNGTTQKAAIRSTTMKNADVENCIIHIFTKMKFPSPPGGGIVRVNYPLTFTP